MYIAIRKKSSVFRGFIELIYNIGYGASFEEYGTGNDYSGPTTRASAWLDGAISYAIQTQYGDIYYDYTEVHLEDTYSVY